MQQPQPPLQLALWSGQPAVVMSSQNMAEWLGTKKFTKQRFPPKKSKLAEADYRYYDGLDLRRNGEGCCSHLCRKVLLCLCAVLPSRGHTACNSVALSLDAARRLAQWLHQQASDGGRKKMCLDLLAKLNGLAASDFQSAPLLPAPDFVMPAFELTPPAQPVARNVLFTPPATKRPMHQATSNRLDRYRWHILHAVCLDCCATGVRHCICGRHLFSPLVPTVSPMMCSCNTSSFLVTSAF